MLGRVYRNVAAVAAGLVCALTAKLPVWRNGIRDRLRDVWPPLAWLREPAWSQDLGIMPASFEFWIIDAVMGVVDRLRTAATIRSMGFVVQIPINDQVAIVERTLPTLPSKLIRGISNLFRRVRYSLSDNLIIAHKGAPIGLLWYPVETGNHSEQEDTEFSGAGEAAISAENSRPEATSPGIAKDLQLYEPLWCLVGLARLIDGGGAFGSVHLALYIDQDGEEHEAAVKIAKLNETGVEKGIGAFLKELECFEKVPIHKNIVHCFGGHLPRSGADNPKQKDVFIVEERMDMNLRDIIKGRRTPWTKWTYRMVMCIFREINDGLKHLHDQRVSHYDLKPENILVNVVAEMFPLIIKIADFGCSQIKQKTYASLNFAGTPEYMAPEVLACEALELRGSGKIDIYSLGVVMWEVLTGGVAKSIWMTTHKSCESDNVCAMLSNRKLRIGDHHPPELAKLLRSCIEWDSSKRLKSDQVAVGIDLLMSAPWLDNEVFREGA